MSKILLPFLLIAIIGSACSGAVETPDQVVQPGDVGSKPVVTIFRPPT